MNSYLREERIKKNKLAIDCRCTPAERHYKTNYFKRLFFKRIAKMYENSTKILRKLMIISILKLSSYKKF